MSHNGYVATLTTKTE